MSQSKNGTYGRNASVSLPQAAVSTDAAPENTAQGEQRVQIDGFNQVLEMLKIADPEFRESLLRRLAARDKDLARNLRRDLAAMGL
ncbi:MAG: hypothetical protein ACXWP5_15695 [Bdellovibrionota bacterium]